MTNGSSRVELDPDQLVLLLEGLDLSKVQRPKRWEPKRDRQSNPIMI
jgi:hypothetical protein